MSCGSASGSIPGLAASLLWPGEAWSCAWLQVTQKETESERRKNLCRNLTKREGSIKFALKNNKWGRKVKCFLSIRKTSHFIKGDVIQIK